MPINNQTLKIHKEISPPHPPHTLVKNKTSSHQIECGARMPLSRKGGAAIDAEGKPPLFPDAVNSRCVFHICLLPEKKWKSMKRDVSWERAKRRRRVKLGLCPIYYSLES